jgi:hypothetical protein
VVEQVEDPDGTLGTVTEIALLRLFESESPTVDGDRKVPVGKEGVIDRESAFAMFVGDAVGVMDGARLSERSSVLVAERVTMGVIVVLVWQKSPVYPLKQ